MEAFAVALQAATFPTIASLVMLVPDDLFAFRLPFDLWLKGGGIPLKNGLNGEPLLGGVVAVVPAVVAMAAVAAHQALREALAVELETAGVFAVTALIAARLGRGLGRWGRRLGLDFRGETRRRV